MKNYTGKKRKYFDFEDYKIHQIYEITDTTNIITSLHQLERESLVESKPKRFKKNNHKPINYSLLSLPLDLKNHIFIYLLNKKEKRRLSSTNKEWRFLFDDYYLYKNKSHNHMNWNENFSQNVLFNFNRDFRRFLGLYINLWEKRGSIEDYDIFKKLYMKIDKFPFIIKDSLIKKYPYILIEKIRSGKMEEKHNLIKNYYYTNTCNEIEKYFEKQHNNCNINEFAIKLHYFKFIKNKNISLNINYNCSILDSVINYEELKDLKSTDNLSIAAEFYTIWQKIIDLDSGPTINSIRAVAYLNNINLEFGKSSHYYGMLYKNTKYLGEFINITDIRNIFKSFVKSGRYHKSIKIFNKYIKNRHYITISDLYILRYIYTKTNQKNQLIDVCKKIINMLDVFATDYDYICLADVYFSLEKYKESIYYYKKTNTKYSNIYTIYKIMLSNIKLKEYEKALKFGIKLSKLPIKDLSKKQIKDLLFVFSRSKNYPESVNLCKKYIEVLDGSCTINDLRNAYYINYVYGEVDDSIKYCEYIANRSDSSIYDYLNAGYFLFKMKNYEKEKEYFYKALEIAKKDIRLNKLIITYIISLYEIPVSQGLLNLLRK